MKKFSLLTAIIIALSALDAEAQRRTTYESLVQRTDQPSTYIDHLVIPKSDSTGVAAFLFRLDYDFVPFLRKRPNMTPPTPEDEYFAPVRMGIEIFQGALTESRRSARQIGTSVYRDAWSDTVWVATFDETKSRYNHVTGFLKRELKKGPYNFELQLGRGESIREMASQRRNLVVPDYTSTETNSIFILNSLDISDYKITAGLLNYGNNVLYGQDYSLLVPIPLDSVNEGDSYQLSIYRVRPGSTDEPESDARYKDVISSNELLSASLSSISQKDNEIYLQLDLDDNGFKYAYFRIPNAEFENARYKVLLKSENSEKPIAERIINSQWIDMPVSLYNIDVAIDMLKFIVTDSELRIINSGSTAEREQKFREFWAQRDPTPDSEFNELMAEYYNRIDHAFRNFSSLQVPGYETDQGRAFILYGQPINVERRLPANRPAREIWQYSDRTLIFEATTGFGDFRLVAEE
jgi:GWxTD domain-containing protein